MDSITQAALGAVIGRVTISRAGVFPLFAGAVAGTMPDFDWLLSPFVSDVSAFVEHRSATHSLLLAPLAAWFFARLMGYWKLSRREWLSHREWLSRREWFWLFFWCFVTHILLDLCTSYGTQILWPLSREPFSLSWIFIVDPLYTLPLLITVMVCLLNRHGKMMDKQRRGAAVVLILTTLYIGLGAFLNEQAREVFVKSMAARGITAKAFVVQNAPLTIFQWKALAVNEEGDWTGWLSSFDGETPEWQFVKKIKKAQAVEVAASTNSDYKRLQSFSRGFYRLEKYDNDYYLTDLRFGGEGIRPFSFLVAETNAGGDIVAAGEIIGVERNTPEAFVLRFNEWLGRF